MIALVARMVAMSHVQMVMVQLTDDKLEQDFYSTSFSPSLCVTHRCNLSCVYCYQENKSDARMTIDTAKKCIDDIFCSIPKNTKIIEISFIGGEPLLEINLIKDVYDYTINKYSDSRLRFFATTNGTTLSDDDKEWFKARKERFILGLSLDGTPSTHNKNRSNSFDRIDIPFFVNTWPQQGPKMTISRHTINSLADDIIFIHNQGFKTINGVNFAEGDFDWGNNCELEMLSKQLRRLLDFYTINYSLNLDQMFGKHIEFCAGTRKGGSKACGIGKSTAFYDVDGKKYPCSFVTPLTFSEKEMQDISKIDFSDPKVFVDTYCLNNCYIYPVCNSCAGANYLVNHSFSERIKSRCNFTKLICLYISELHARRIFEHRELYNDENQLFFLIEAIKKIKEKYLDEFRQYLL